MLAHRENGSDSSRGLAVTCAGIAHAGPACRVEIPDVASQSGSNGSASEPSRVDVLQAKAGSPAWIRTTIHGSKGRCPTVRRPGNYRGGLASSVYPGLLAQTSPVKLNQQLAEAIPGRCRARASNPACVTSWRGWVRHPLASANCADWRCRPCRPLKLCGVSADRCA